MRLGVWRGGMGMLNRDRSCRVTYQLWCGGKGGPNNDVMCDEKLGRRECIILHIWLRENR